MHLSFPRLTLAVITLLPLAAAADGHPASPTPTATAAAAEHDGARDFDFLVGRYQVRNRRLVERLAGSDQWEEFEATHDGRLILGGLGNIDEFRTEHWPGFIGASLRIYDPERKLWSIYWVDNKAGVLQPPVVGAFHGDTGVFEGPDHFQGRPILVRFTWSRVTSARPRWEQAFSADGGKTWETNWVAEFTRLDR